MCKYSLGYLRTSVKVIFFCFFLSSCGTNKFDVDISDIQIDIKFDRFEKDLISKGYGSTKERTEFLQEKYGSFYDYFCGQALRIDPPGTPAHEIGLDRFISHPSFSELFDDVDGNFKDLSELEAKLIDDFKRYKYHFPEKMIPAVYTYVSGFNFSIIRTDSAIGVGLDLYIDTLDYTRLQYPSYVARKKKKKFIEIDFF